jgi:hypothetical protein
VGAGPHDMRSGYWDAAMVVFQADAVDMLDTIKAEKPTIPVDRSHRGHRPQAIALFLIYQRSILCAAVGCVGLVCGNRRLTARSLKVGWRM